VSEHGVVQDQGRAVILIESWRRHYNEVRPHSSIDYMTPNEFKKQNLTILGGALLA
jgi:transposase InsO family protein